MARIKVNSGLMTPKAINVYMGGQWLLRKVGKVFNGGVWKDFITYIKLLYTLGVENVVIVRGVLSGGGTMTLTKNADHISLSASRASGNASDISAVTDLPIDLTNYSKVFVDWDLVNSSGTRGLVVSTSKIGDYTIFDAKLDGGTNSTGGRVVRELDISSLNGVFYIRVHARMNNTVTGNTITNLYRLWLE